MKTPSNAALESLLADNRAAVDELTRVAADIPRKDWARPLGEEKWSAAQHVQHIVLAYETMVRDIRHGQRAQLKGTANQRRLWRLVGLPQVLWMRRLPRGAPSPREMRPSDSPPVRPALLAQLRDAVDDFDSAMRVAWRGTPGHRVLHPYFGEISLRQALVLAAVHTRHHIATLRLPVSAAR
jgi:hypothetical protein